MNKSSITPRANKSIMTRSGFLTNLIILVVSSAVLAGMLWMILGGAHGFSFYGLATCAIVALPILAVLLIKRAKTLSQSRWPIILVTSIAVLLALVQVGYWFAFFNTGTDGLPLAIGRALMPPAILQSLAWSPLIMGLLLLVFIARALRT